MKIELHRIKIRELAEGYVDDAESGVRGYGGRLDIRPAYQREFVYREKERDAVISTVMRGFPLNVITALLRHADSVLRELGLANMRGEVPLCLDAP